MTLPTVVPPSILPIVRNQGHTIALGDLYSHDEKSTGHNRSRRLKTSTTRQVTIDWFLNQSQMTALHNWFERALTVGSRTFSIRVQNQGPGGLLWWEAAWLEPYKAEPQTRGWWHVTGTLRLLGTGQTIGPDLQALAIEYDFPLTGSATIETDTSLAIEYDFELVASPTQSIAIEYGLELARSVTICSPPAGSITITPNTVSIPSTASTFTGLIPYGYMLANVTPASPTLSEAEGVTFTDYLDLVVGSTRGEIIYRGSSTWQALSAGSEGYVLTTHSTSADPTWSPNTAGDLSWKSPVKARTTADLGGYTYSNGSSGVGATLTAPNNSAFGTLDGQSISVGDRVLIANESTASHNGIYTATVISTGSTNTQFTRATDNDTAARMGDAVVVVAFGTLYAGKQFIQSVPAASITMGSTSLTWVSPPVLNYWTEALGTGTPNATVNVSSYTASGGSTNQDAAIAPKGTGALLGAIPDNSSTGGNKRGAYAVDIQLSRASAAQIAEADYSGLFAGHNNTITNGGFPGSTDAVILGGTGNTINASQGAGLAIIGGDTNTYGGGTRGAIIGAQSVVVGSGGATYGIVTGYNHSVGSSFAWNYGGVFGRGHTLSSATGGCDYSFVTGFGNTVNNVQSSSVFGQSNSVTASYQLVAGLNNVADGDCGFVWGQYATQRGMVGSNAFARTRRAATGDIQRRDAILNAQTTDATPTALTVGGGAAGNTNQFKLATGPSVIKVSGHVVAINRTSGDTSCWEISGMCKQISGTVSLVGSATVTLVAQDSGASSWSVAVVADNTNKCLQVQVTGASSTTVDWVSHCYVVEAA